MENSMPTQKEQSEKRTSTTSQASKTGRGATHWNEIESSLTDLKSTFGFVPSFVNNVVEPGLPGAWTEAKQLRFGTNTALDTKLKGLISLAISSQIPCDRISYFEQNATIADGATYQEQLEAVMMSALTRHWSTVLNGSQIDKVEFKKEVDTIMAYVKRMMEDSHGQTPPEEMFLVKPTTASEAYEDMQKTLGVIPKFFLVFPKEAIAGAWSEFKGVQLNPHTALNGKQKELIGLAVAAQIPCDYCITFHRNACVLNGVSDREIQESIGVAALTRHWSALFHGPQIELESFKKDADQMIKNSAQHRLQ
jgi:AhpD family alkylhydroperoxidase